MPSSDDQHKGFDKVSRTFPMKILDKLRFGTKFRKWVSILYCITRGCLLIIGNLSLYDFSESFARYINSSDNFRGIGPPSGNGKYIKPLQYADDVLCVTAYRVEVIQHLNAFDLFQISTSISVSMHKTCGLKLGS